MTFFAIFLTTDDSDDSDDYRVYYGSDDYVMSHYVVSRYVTTTKKAPK